MMTTGASMRREGLPGEQAPQARERERAPALQIILLAAVVRLGLAALSLRLGFVEYNADGATRVIHGWEWLQAPRWEVSVWLPLHFWLLGGTLALWDNLIWAPRLLATLAGLATIASLTLIADTLAGRRAALATALLAAAFPFEVWFSVSGMAEPVFHALVAGAALGLVRWQARGSRRALLLGALSLLAATAVRYEGWFYAAVFALLVLALAWRRGQLGRATIAAALVPLLFMGLWVEQSWAVFGDPLAFAHETATIKTELDPGNRGASLLARLVYYPEAALRIERPLVLLGLLACAWLLWRRRRAWGGYLALVFGQAALLIAVSAAFANMGPGSERYLLSNVLLLLPPLGAVLAGASEGRGRHGGLPLRESETPVGAGPRACPAPRAVTYAICGAIALILLVSFGRQLAAPPVTYPDADTRALGAVLAGALAVPDAQGRAAVPVLLPPPPTDAFNAGYALRVRSGQPAAVTITWEQARLDEAVTSGAARLWVVDTTTGAALPPAERTERVGRFVVGWPPPVARVTVEGGAVRASGFLPGEAVGVWLTAPDGATLPLPDARADQAGDVALRAPLPAGAAPGEWAVTLSGRDSQRLGIAHFAVWP